MRKRDTLDWDVIRRKIEGELSATEQKALRDWARKDRRRVKFLDSAGKYYAKDFLPEVGEQQMNQAWERFRISRQNKHRIFYRHMLRWGVAALVLIALGSGIWLFQDRQPVLTAEGMITPIQPGKSKASLVLSTGKIVELQTGSPRRFSDLQAEIHMDSTGIAYQVANDSVQPVFHTLRIPQGGEYCLSLSDGTRIWLNAKTELSYPVFFTGKERRVKLKGEAYFDVARNEMQPFIVETDRMEVKVLGTTFNVNAYADEPEVVTTLVTGSVQIQDSGRAVGILQPSEQALWSREKGTLCVRKVNTDCYTQWREGSFIFRNDDLESIFRILARWYDLEYEFSEPELKSERFYGTTGRYENIVELLRQFEKTGKVHFAYQGNKVIIKK